MFIYFIFNFENICDYILLWKMIIFKVLIILIFSKIKIITF